jgi:hypothetical protein
MALATLIQPRVCELGKIKIGGLGESRPAANGGTWRLPEKLDHFVVTTLQRDADGGLIVDADLMASLSEHSDRDGKLRQIPIALLSNDVEEVLQAAWVWYCGKKLGARSDGRTVTWFHNPNNKARLDSPRTEEWIPNGRFNHLFKLHTTMSVVIAAKQARWGGVYKFRSTSQITASQVYGSLMHLRELTGGLLRGLPLRMVVRPVQVTPEGQPKTVYVVHVELGGSDFTKALDSAMQRAQLEMANAKQLRESQREYRALLSSPAEFDDDVDEEATGEEFHGTASPRTASRPDLLRGVDDLCAAMGCSARELMLKYSGLDLHRVETVDQMTNEQLATMVEAAMRDSQDFNSY